MPPKKKVEPSSLGEVTAGHFKSSIEGLTRLASQHPSVRHILDVLTRLRERALRHQRDHSRRARHRQRGAGAHAARAHASRRRAAGVGVDRRSRPRRVWRSSCSAPGRDTRAIAPVDGAVGEADGGTLVLDEVIGLSPALQRRLLDLRQARPLSPRVRGSRARRRRSTSSSSPTATWRARCRRGASATICSTSSARLDLVLPPLRERHEDVPGAARWMANRVRLDRGLPANVELEGDDARRGGIDHHPQGRHRRPAPASLAGQLPRARDHHRARAHALRRRHAGHRRRRAEGARRTDVSDASRDKIADRIARQLGAPDLLDKLVALPASELTSLLLETFRRRSAARTPAELLAAGDARSLGASDRRRSAPRRTHRSARLRRGQRVHADDAVAGGAARPQRRPRRHRSELDARRRAQPRGARRSDDDAGARDGQGAPRARRRVTQVQRRRACCGCSRSTTPPSRATSRSSR